MHDGGHIRNITQNENGNGKFEIVEWPFQGSDSSGNPIYGAKVVVASGPVTDARGVQNPASVEGAIQTMYPRTGSGRYVTFVSGSSAEEMADHDPPQFHLGALEPGNNDDFAFRASPAGAFKQSGNGINGEIIEGDGTFNVTLLGNFGNLAGVTMTQGPHLLFGYYGEFWNNSQSNQWLHWLENGLFVGQFGVNGPIGNIDKDKVIAGMAGNNSSSNLVKAGGNIYLYHNDEHAHAGLHRWRVDNLDTLQEMAGNIGKDTQVTNPSQVIAVAIPQ
jgi:hypothetical protein